MLNVRRASCLTAVLALLLVAGSGPLAQGGPTLQVQGNHLTLNGTPQYLIFISYFDALRRANAGDLHTDFGYLSGKVDGIRIFPNWLTYTVGCPPQTTGETLLDGNGNIRDGSNWNGPGASPWDRLISVLDTASAYSLVVDVSFTHDTVPGLLPNYPSGLQRVASRLRGQYPNAMFDIQNEFDKNGPQGADLQNLVAAVRNPTNGDPGRIVFASQGGGGSGQTVGADANGYGFHVVGFHDPRDPDGWFLESRAQSMVNDVNAGLGGANKPIYLQEPRGWLSLCTTQNDENPGHHLDAVKWYKKYDAAAWTFHTRSSFDLSTQTLFEKLLGDPDQKFTIENLKNSAASVPWGPQPPVLSVNFRSWNGPYMVAENGGGGVINADRDNAGSWETFTLHDLDGGGLRDGHRVTMRTDNGSFLQADGGGPGAMLAVGGSEGPWETFTISNLDQSGQAIGSGTHVALRSVNGYFTVAESGGYDVVNVNRTGVGPWETWTLIVR
jgi:hypothetical protein